MNTVAPPVLRTDGGNAEHWFNDRGNCLPQFRRNWGVSRTAANDGRLFAARRRGVSRQGGERYARSFVFVNRIAEFFSETYPTSQAFFAR